MGSLVICVTVACFNIYYHYKYSIFKKGYGLLFRFVQEMSIALIVSIIALFYFDEEFTVLMDRNTKLRFTSALLILICINILLEIISGVITITIMAISQIKKLKNKPK